MVRMLNKFQACNTILLSVVTMLYSRSLELIHLSKLKHSTLWPTSHHFPPVPSSWQPLFYSVLLCLILDFKYTWYHAPIFFLYLAYFTCLISSIFILLQMAGSCVCVCVFDWWMDKGKYNHFFFIHSSVDEHLEWIHTLFIVNNPEINMAVQM